MRTPAPDVEAVPRDGGLAVTVTLPRA